MRSCTKWKGFPEGGWSKKVIRKRKERQSHLPLDKSKGVLLGSLLNFPLGDRGGPRVTDDHIGAFRKFLIDRLRIRFLGETEMAS